MGNTRSVHDHEEEEDLWWNPPSAAPLKRNDAEDDDEEEVTDRRQRMKKELDEFKLELARKHEKRRELIVERKKELASLREQVAVLTKENEDLRETKDSSGAIRKLRQENEELRANITKITAETGAIEEIRSRNLELKMTIAEMQKELQELNAEMVSFEKERQDYKNHVTALKDVVTVSKQMLLIRENQLKELKQKVGEIEASLAGRELNTLSLDLQREYEKQLQNMRSLRIIYEDRLRAHGKEKEEMKRLLDGTKKELQEEQEKNSELEETVARLEEENSKKYDEIKSLESDWGLSKAECRQYQAELAVINQLFSQILVSFNSNQEIDIDRLIALLEENHHILQDIAVNEVSNEVASTLPKVLLDLVREASDKGKEEDEEQKLQKEAEPQNSHQLNSASEIVENLPKVWRILIELLSHQCAPVNILTGEGNENPCYKVVETPKGPLPVLSVSQTFIRLKDLILEKKSLERETGHLKNLNTHLECRLQEQEKRLEMVSTELTETWHVVGKLQKKHQLLHTQEKILRYELAQKRKLLTELKEELEYSREKWQEAREKNSTTERQWEELRSEFASRKVPSGDDLNNSIESGYSDGRECSSEDEPGYETDISECNQKLSSGDEPETETPTNTVLSQKRDDKPIVDVIQEEIAAIVSDGSDKTESVENEPKKSVEEAASSSKTEGMSEEPERSLEQVLSAREERLQRLEGQCSNLVKQVASTSNRSVAICNKLDALHEIYGEQGRRNERDPDGGEEDAAEAPDAEE